MTAPGGKRKRRFELKRKQKRRAKIKRLKARYQAAKTETERKQFLEKLVKTAPHYSIEQFQSIAVNR